MGEYTKTLEEIKELAGIKNDLKKSIAQAGEGSMLWDALQEDLKEVNEAIAEKAEYLASL